MPRHENLPALKPYRKMELCVYCYKERNDKFSCCGEAHFETHYYNNEFKSFIDVNDNYKLYDEPNEATLVN